MHVALVVGAGGPTGGPFIWSALEALERRTGWAPASANVVIGTSAGAFVAASFESQKPANHAAVKSLDELAGSAGQPDLAATGGTRVASVARRLAGRVVALIAPTGRPIAEYQVPSHPFHPGAAVVTVEHRSGRRVQHTLSNASNPEAVVRASAAIPGLNGPVLIGSRRHVDGAVHSANNVALVDPDAVSVIVVISPMIPATGGSLVSRFHRAQLREELRPWQASGRSVLVIMPSEGAHANRRDRETFGPEGARVVDSL